MNLIEASEKAYRRIAANLVVAVLLAVTTVSLTAAGFAQPPTSAEQRMAARFPQPVRVGDLIGLPVLDQGSRILGYVRQLVRAPGGKIDLIIAYGGWFGWAARLVAVPIEVVGIRARELVSLDMPRRDYVSAPTWQQTGGMVLADNESVRVALAGP